MEQVIRHNGGAESLGALRSQFRECFGRVAYAHKTQEKCADIYYRRMRGLKVLQIILSTITATGALSVIILNDSRLSSMLTAVMSAILLFLNIYTKEYDLSELVRKHAASAVDLWNVRESYLSLLVDIDDEAIDMNRLRQRRDELQETLKGIYKVAPRTLPKAYRMAQSALQLNEELKFSNKEIDKMLPESLRMREK